MSNKQRVRPVLTETGVEYVPTLTQELLNFSKSVAPNTVDLAKKGWDKTKAMTEKVTSRLHHDESDSVVSD